MKKWVLVVLCCLFLTGCASAPVFETIADEWQEDLPASAGEIQLELPPDAAMSCMKLRRIPRRGRISYLDRVNNIQTSESLQSKISLMGIQ